MSRMRPPLTTSMTEPRTTPSSSLIFSIVPQARSYCARFFDRIRRPSLSSFWRTSASMCSPTDTTSAGSTSCLIDLDDGAFDNVAVIEVLDGLIDRGEERFLGAQVVFSDLLGAGGAGGVGGRTSDARGGLDAARHVGCCSGWLLSGVTLTAPEGRPPDAPWRPWTIVGCVRTTADLLPAEVRGPRVHRPAYLLPYHTVQPSPDTRTVIRCARGQRAHDRSPAGDQTGRRRRGDHARQPALVGRPGRRLPGRTRAVPG